MIGLGPFDLVAPVGRGGMGEVWRATHRASLAPVAIKLLKRAHMRSDRHLAILRSEIRAMARLDHPGVVWILGTGTVTAAAERQSAGALAADTTWLAMELASGGSLTDRMAGIVDWAAASRILSELLAALAHAHGRGVIHRDLKPGNILLALPSDLRPGWKLTDFGLATALGDYGAQTQHGIAGTPQYMAPEQIDRAIAPHGPWTDLYSLGCLAWAIVTGRSPYGRFKGAEAALAHLTRPLPDFEPRFPVPDGVGEWLGRLLEREVDDRFQLAATAAAALRELEPPRELSEHEETVRIGSLERYARGRPGGDVPIAWRERNPTFPRILRGAGIGMVGVRVPRFAGRLRERDALWALLRAVAAERAPRSAIVRGPPGMGRSRLAAWLCERAHELGVADHAIVPLAAGESSLRSLVARLLRLPVRVDRHPPWLDPLLESLDDAELSAALLAILEETGGGASSPADVEPVRALLRLRTEGGQPLVVVLDDVERAPDVLPLVTRLAATRLPILWVLTTSAARGALPGLEPLGAAEVALGPLDPVARADLLGEYGLAPGLASRLDGEAGGSPRAVVARLAGWSRRGRLVGGPTGIDLAPGVPWDADDTWRAELDALAEAHPGALEELTAAAAIGPVVDWARWDAAGTPGAYDLRWAIAERLVSVGAAEELADGIRLVDPTLVETVAVRAGPAWPAVNARCAELLGAGLGPERLGLCLLRAGRATEAVDPLLEAADARHRDHGWRACLGMLGEAGQALEQAGTTDPRWAALAIRSATAWLEIGEHAEARVWAERAILHARRGGSPAIPARAALVLGRILAADLLLDAAVGKLHEAVAAANAASARDVAAAALLALSHASAARGERVDALRQVEAAIRAWERVGAGPEADVALARAWEAELGGRLVEARERLEEARFQAAGDATRELAVTEAAADLERRARSPEVAEMLWTATLARAERLGSAAAARAVTGLAASRIAQDRGLAAWEDLAVQGARHPPAGALAVTSRAAVHVAASAAAGRWDEVDHQVTLALDAAEARPIGMPDVLACLELALSACRDPELARKLRRLEEDHRRKPMGIT